MTNLESAAALIRINIQALVDDESTVDVELLANGNAHTLRVMVANTDIGKVIGKQGRTARAIRTILGAHAQKIHTSIGLDIVSR